MGDVTTIQTVAARQAMIREKAQEAADLALEVKALSERRKAIFDDIEAHGVDRAAFKDMIKLARKEADEREAYETSRAEIARAFGWDDGSQRDIFDDEVDNRDGDADEAEQSMARAGKPGDLLRGREQA